MRFRRTGRIATGRAGFRRDVPSRTRRADRRQAPNLVAALTGGKAVSLRAERIRKRSSAGARVTPACCRIICLRVRSRKRRAWHWAHASRWASAARNCNDDSSLSACAAKCSLMYSRQCTIQSPPSAQVSVPQADSLANCPVLARLRSVKTLFCCAHNRV